MAERLDDMDIRVESDSDELFRTIPRIKETLQLNVELASQSRLHCGETGLAGA